MKLYTVVGFYADNQQPWIQFVEASTPKAAAKKGITQLYDNGSCGAELEASPAFPCRNRSRRYIELKSITIGDGSSE